MRTASIPVNDIGSQLSSMLFSAQFVQLVVTILFAFLFPITSAAIINYLERKILAWVQDRAGPLHTGPHGSLQLLADIGKMFTKEDIHAAKSDRLLFLLAPSAFIAPVIASFAVLPFSPFLGLPGTALATGIVYLVAMSSLDVIG
ncbi:MAG TPA: NADH-quinone oxidoreductase subunit H, partial [Ktedonobacteraceae bacterium]|nr:NADH-quinone oxidoreductase subunit H [Ktedonobacteraceae bacterium]